ncbi:MAG: DUF983 domain-containing protein [Asticcacaulis sp.]
MTESHGRKVDFLAAGLGKCPICTKGKLFKSYLKTAESCEACGQNFKAADTGDGPVVFVILIAGFIACAGLMTTFFMYPDWSPLVHLLLWPPVAVIVSLVLMPVLKGLMIASQLKNQVRD